MENIKEIFGKNVKKYRKLVGFTQEEMAEKINVSQTFFANIERGKRGASFETVELLSKCFNIPYSALFEDSEQNNSITETFVDKTVKDIFFYKDLENKLEKCLKEAIHNCLQIFSCIWTWVSF